MFKDIFKSMLAITLFPLLCTNFELSNYIYSNLFPSLCLYTHTEKGNKAHMSKPNSRLQRYMLSIFLPGATCLFEY